MSPPMKGILVIVGITIVLAIICAVASLIEERRYNKDRKKLEKPTNILSFKREDK